MASDSSRSAASVLSCPQALPQALQNLLSVLGTDFPADGVFVNTYYPQTHEVRFLAHATQHAAREIFDVVVISEEMLASSRMPLSENAYRIDDIEKDPFTRLVAPKIIEGIRSYVMVRLRLEGRHLGVACFYSRKCAAFDETHVRQAVLLRDLLSLQVGFALSVRIEQRNSHLEQLNKKLTAAIEHSRPLPLAALLHNTPSMRALQPLIEQAALYDIPVLITGESGTGKEVVAHTIHNMSNRANRPFVRVNCSAIPESLMEAELFGHEPGAFTDARKLRRGLFEEADGGTLFLDEIGELPLSMQAKMLHAVQDKRIRRIGAAHEIPVDIRIISATNRNLGELVAQKRFRLDLYYRLNVLNLAIRPLRERPEDFAPLIRLFLKETQTSYHVLSPKELFDVLVREAGGWSWPGNVRELRNAVMRSVLTAAQDGGRSRLVLGDSGGILSTTSSTVQSQTAAAGLAKDANGQWLDFETLQKRYFEELLQACRGRISGSHGAARIAGMHPNTLRSRLQKLGLLAAQAPGDGVSKENAAEKS